MKRNKKLELRPGFQPVPLDLKSHLPRDSRIEGKVMTGRLKVAYKDKLEKEKVNYVVEEARKAAEHRAKQTRDQMAVIK